MKKLYIIKIGGNVIDNPQNLEQFLQDFAQIQHPKILVHGGGKIATKIAQELGIETQMHEGKRITDSDSLRVIQMVYGGLINKNIVAYLQSLSCSSIGLSGADGNVILAQKRPVKDIDYGWVGDIQSVHATFLDSLLQQNLSVVLAPLTHDGKGNMLNTNADTIASQTAKAMSQFYETHLIYCFEKKGVLLDSQNEESVIASITQADFERLKDQQIVHTGMIPKLENALEAIKTGVKKVVIAQAQALKNYQKGNFVGTVIES